MVALAGLWLKDNWRSVAGALGVLALLLTLNRCGYNDGVKHEAGKTAEARQALDLCSTALAHQNATLKAQAASDAAKLKVTTTSTAKTLKSQSGTPAKVTKALAPPRGATLLDRYEDVDKRVLEAQR